MLNDEVDTGLDAAEQRVLALLDNGDDSAAAAAYSRKPDLRPLATLLWVRGSARRAAGENELASHDFLRCAAELSPRGSHGDAPLRGWLRAKAYGSAGECLYSLSRFEEAYEAFRHAITEIEGWLETADPAEVEEKRPSYAWLNAMASESVREMGREADALSFAERAVALDPAHASWHVTHGLVLQRLGRHNEAIEAFDRAIERNPELAGVHGHRAKSLAALGDNEAAIVAAQHYASREPGDIAALLGIVNVALAGGDLAAVRDAARTFAERLPQDLPALRQRADEIEEQSPEQAASLLTGILDVHPGEPEALRLRGMLRLYDFEDYVGALEDFQAALAAVSSDPNRVAALRLQHLIGETYWALDQYANAVAAYEAALPHEKDAAMIAEIHLRLAESLIPLGRIDEARPHLLAFWHARAAFMDEIGDEERLSWAREQLGELDEAAE